MSSRHDLVLTAHRLTLNLKVESGQMPNWFGKGWGEEMGECRVENVLCCVIRRKERVLLFFLTKATQEENSSLKHCILEQGSRNTCFSP